MEYKVKFNYYAFTFGEAREAINFAEMLKNHSDEDKCKVSIELVEDNPTKAMPKEEVEA